MKKAIAIVALAATFAIAFVSCGKGTCEACGKENVSLSTIKDEITGSGETAKVCKDCKAEYDAAVKLAKELGL